LIEKLTQEHRSLKSASQKLEPGLKEIINGHAITLGHLHFKLLISRYKAHAGSEETVFLPLSKKILGCNSNHMTASGLPLHMRHVPHFTSHI